VLVQKRAVARGQSSADAPLDGCDRSQRRAGRRRDHRAGFGPDARELELDLANLA
jgi:hypothetical protein